jgi:hydrophobe/amphiphile efflux-1 (HAE1) family protein
LISRFFIDRPIFAWVIAIIIVLAGALAITRLPIEQYPNLVPPIVAVSASYPGASARTIEESVTQVIEQAMKGIDNVDYMTSSSSSQGNASVSLTFTAGTDPDLAQVQVQNKLQQALRQLPQVVQQQGVNVQKQTSGFLTMVAFYSDNPAMTRAELSDYINTNVADPLARLTGVGGTRAFGTPYAMRIWLDPYKLNQFKLMPGDVRQALLAQNTQVSAGQLGGLPSVQGQQLNASITAQGRLQTPEQFRDIVLRVNSDGSSVRLADVARVELGLENYDNVGFLNGKPSTGVAVMLAPGANALETAAAVEAKLQEVARFFPAGLHYDVGFDTAEFVRLSIREVVISLAIATLLVVLIMYLFLGNWRATLIPTVAVPVVLLGTFGVLAVFGYSINTLTMFAMVLAIGLLVDDAIVVVENVERVMQEEGLSARDATRRSMEQITGALLGVALVLAAVFIPMAFFGGATGVIYRQFSITIVSAMVLSITVALVLTPAICANLLHTDDVQQADGGQGFFGWFNRHLRQITLRYQAFVARLVQLPRVGFLAYGALIVMAALLLWRMPGGFLPTEDQGSLTIQAQLPPGATQQRTLAVLDQMKAALVPENRAVRVTMQMTSFGNNGGGSGQNSGSTILRLKAWNQRDKSQSATAIAARLARSLTGIRDARVFVNLPSTVRGLGSGSGFELQLMDLNGVGHDALVAAREQFIQQANADPALSQVRAGGVDDQPEYHVDVDQAKAAALGLSISDVNDTLSTALGGSYVNDFINKGRVKKVYVQADAPYRMQPGDLDGWYVRNQSGDMVPLAQIATGSWTRAAPRLERYDAAAALSLNGEAAEGHSTGNAMKAVEKLLAQMLPAGIGYEWSGVSYEERKAGAQSSSLYAISILFVFLCLAALYESWSLPFSVMLVVPLGVLGALGFSSLRGLDNDVYFQIALVTTIGLAAKNAILIVEFAKKLYMEGMELVPATLQAVRIRLRPILMTSLAFMLGVMPLVLGTGAGAAGRIAIGTGVFGGMFAGTLLGIFFVPLFFVVVQRHLARETRRPPTN